MKKLFILLVMCLCISATQAQFLKKLKAKIDQSAKDVKAKVKEKVETAPDRIIDHTANKVQTKAESKIDAKENKANSKVDNTVDKVDSIKIKKLLTKEPKDSLQGTASFFWDINKPPFEKYKSMAALIYNFNSVGILSFYKPDNFFYNS
jgi:hypothetical protein